MAQRLDGKRPLWGERNSQPTPDEADAMENLENGRCGVNETTDETDALKNLENGRCGVNETADSLPMKLTR